MKTLTTHIAKVRQQHLSQIDEVCQLLDWTHQQYCQHQFEQYQAFISILFKNYPELIKEVEYSAVFRGFWNKEAAKRNAEWLAFARSQTRLEVILEVEDVFRQAQQPKVEDEIEGIYLNVLQPLPYGDDYLVGEYLFEHRAKRLLIDQEFMNNYYHTLKLI